MSQLSRLLYLIPEIRRLREERDELQSERGSMRLKVRAASAEMGVLEDQSRALKSEGDRLVQDVARQTTELERQAAQLADALAASEAVAKERDALVLERDVKPPRNVDTESASSVPSA